MRNECCMSWVSVHLTRRVPTNKRRKLKVSTIAFPSWLLWLNISMSGGKGVRRNNSSVRNKERMKGFPNIKKEMFCCCCSGCNRKWAEERLLSEAVGQFFEEEARPGRERDHSQV